MVSPIDGSQTPPVDRRAETASSRGNIAGRSVSNVTGSRTLEVASTISSPPLSSRDLTGRVAVESALAREPTAKELEDLRRWVNHHTGLQIETVDELLKVEALDLDNTKLTELPNSIGFLKGLKRLLLNGNQLTSLPESIGSLSQLEKLWLYGNQLTSLPKLIGSLSQLKELWLSENQLKLLPESIGSLGQLEKLYIDGNQLKLLPESIGSLDQLEELYIDGNQLTSLPESIGSLTQLKKFYIYDNQFTSIPATLGRCLNLKSLSLHNNKDLAALPMSLGQIPGITYLDIAGTKIPPAECAAILAACRALRDKKTNETLPRRIETWKIFAKSTVDLGAITEFDEQQKQNINEWLVRLERTSDFSREQHALAETVCGILKTVIENQEFREQYFAEIEANLEACQDRAAMSLNEIYTSWRLAVLPNEVSMKEKLKLMAQAAKTFALRELLAARINDQQIKRGQIERESVEIYLYYEIVFQKRLDLLTAIKHMSYGTIGKRDWIQEEDLIKAVETNYFYQLLNISAFEKMVAKEEWFQEIDHQFQEKLNELESKRESLSSAEYIEQTNVIKAERKEATISKIRDWLPAQMGGSDG